MKPLTFKTLLNWKFRSTLKPLTFLNTHGIGIIPVHHETAYIRFPHLPHRLNGPVANYETAYTLVAPPCEETHSVLIRAKSRSDFRINQNALWNRFHIPQRSGGILLIITHSTLKPLTLTPHFRMSAHKHYETAYIDALTPVAHVVISMKHFETAYNSEKSSVSFVLISTQHRETAYTARNHDRHPLRTLWNRFQPTWKYRNCKIGSEKPVKPIGIALILMKIWHAAAIRKILKPNVYILLYKTGNV